MKSFSTKSLIVTFILILFSINANYSQVGIGTTTPKTSLQVEGDVSDINIPVGVQVPSLTLTQLEAKINGGAYGQDQDGAIVFISDASVGSTNSETTGIVSKGLYYYSHDGSLGVWRTVGENKLWSTTGNFGTNQTENFIGTTDDTPLIFRVNDMTSGRIGNTADKSVFLGYEAGLTDNLTNNQNTFIGYQTGRSNTNGVGNTASGNLALTNNSTGIYNSAFGIDALRLNTIGGYNNAFGSAALYDNTEGERNTAVGTASLGDNTTGDFNSGLGFHSLRSNTTGNSNTAVGKDALNDNTTGSNNTAIGFNADVQTANLTNATAIGANASVATSNSLVLGNNANVGIGTFAPEEKLHVEGTIEVDQKIQANDAGGLELATDDEITRLRILDLGNIVVGANPGSSLGTLNISSANTGISGGLQFNNGGIDDWYIYQNSGLGLSFADDGNDRMIIDNAGNIGIGTSTPQARLHVEGNIEVDQKILANDSGGLELATDEGATRIRIQDNGNVGIGTQNPEERLHVEGTIEVNQKIQAHDSGGLEFATSDGQTQIKINNNGSIRLNRDSSASNVIDAFISQFGYLGLGTTSPDALLHIVSPDSPSVIPNLLIQGGSEDIAIPDGQALQFGHWSGFSFTERMRMNSSGTFIVYGSAQKDGGGVWSGLSDKRLKKNISDYSDGLAEILRIRPVRYQYNERSGNDTSKEHVGVIAQELKDVAPYMLSTFNQDGEDYYNVDSSAMTYMLINAVKELKAENDQLKKKLEKLDQLEAMLIELKADLNVNNNNNSENVVQK